VNAKLNHGVPYNVRSSSTGRARKDVPRRTVAWFSCLSQDFRLNDNIRRWRVSAVGTATSNRPDGPEVGVRAPTGVGSLSCPRCQYRLWGLSKGHRRFFPRVVKRP
jgi:hypothetical protein